jgi:glycopeptide antibiotics resistance protein
MFGIYVILLTWVVLWKLEVPYVGTGVLRNIKLVPFAPSGGAGGSAPSEVALNLVLFVPFGVYLGLLAPSWAWWQRLAAIAGTSLAFEVTQYVLAIGRSDISDVMTNTAGGLLGLGLLALARHRFGSRTATVMTRICGVGTIVVVFAAAAFIVSPLHFQLGPGVRRHTG